MIDRVGQELGNYRLVRLLGRGGFAEVYLGEHIHLSTQAAIKVLYMYLTSEDVEQFRNEARIIAHLEHPHIVRVFDFGIEGNTPFFVMSYAPGGTLRQKHPKGTHVPLPTVISYIKQIAPALQYAHFRKRVHRDIKPENILIGSNHNLILSDFGISIAAHHPHSLTPQAIGGTPYYMAPEQSQGQALPASDQYSLGIMVYEWLSGKRPFDGSSPVEIMLKHLSTPPPPLRDTIPSLSPAIEQVVLKAIAKNPIQRFASVSALAKELEQVYRAEQCTLSLPAAQSLSPPITKVQPTTVSFTVGTPFHAYRGYCRGAPAIAWLPSGPHVASSDINGMIQIWNIASQKHVHTYYGHSQEVLSMAWSPDGGSIASGGNDHTVQIWDIDTGQCRFTYRGHARAVKIVAWSPDGKRIASSSYDGTTQVWEVATGNLVLTYKGRSQFGDTEMDALAWSPDGRWIASKNFESSDEAVVRVWDATIGSLISRYCVDARDKGRKGLRRLGTPLSFIAWSPDNTRIASGPYDKDDTIHVWEVAGGKHITSFEGSFNRGKYDYIPLALAWSPDGQLIASNSAQPEVDIWNATTGKTVFCYRDHSHDVLAIAWSPDGSSIASSSWNVTVEAWQVVTRKRIATYQGHSDKVSLVTWSPNCERIASTDSKGITHIWKVTSGEKICAYTDQHDSEEAMEIRSWFAALEWSPNGNHIATVGKLDSTVYVWDSTTGQNVTTYHHNSLEFVSWAPDSIRIASVGRISLKPGVWQTIVHVWDAAKGEKICEYQCEGPATAIWSPDGKWIVSSDKSGAIHIWHPSTGQERLTYRGHSESVPLVAWSPDGTRIASTSTDSIQVWEVATGKCLAICQGTSKSSFMNLMWSPDSSRITCRDNAYDVHIWDATTGKPLMTHTHPVSNLQKESGWFAVWSPDSVYVAWTSYTSKQTRVWNVFTGNHIVDYSSSSQPAWSSDSSRIAFSSTDITVQVWKAPSS